MIHDFRNVIELAQRVCQRALMATPTSRGYDEVTFRGVTENARRMQPYGLRSVAPRNAEVITLAVNAGRTNKVYLAAENPGDGPTDLQEGEVAIYNQVSGTIVKLDKNGNVTIVPGQGAKVQLGDSVAANLDAVALFTQLQSDFNAFVGKFNGHTHAVAGVTAGMSSVTSATPNAMASNLSASVGSSNVQAKK